MLQKLVDINLDPFLIAWISDYLTDRKQRTVLNGSISHSLPVTSGVPQGSVLGPLLFIIFMSDINSVNLSHESKLLLYADDILLYRPVTSGNDYKFLQEDIDSLSAWCNSNHLTFNEQKCKSMVVSRKRKRCVLPTLLLNGHHMEECNTIKYLGINLTSDLMWSRHVQLVSQRVRRLVGLLYRQFYQYADTNTVKHLYLLLIRPHLEYACTVWDPFLQKDIQLLEKVQTFAEKVCTKQWNWSYEELLHTLQLPSLQVRRKRMKLVLLYKYTNNMAYFSEPPLVQHQLYYSTPASHSHHLHYLSVHTCRYLSSFFPQSVRMWNELPASLPCCNSISTFKRCLCKHFVIGYT